MIIERYPDGTRKKKEIIDKNGLLWYRVSYDKKGLKHGLEHSAAGMNFIYEHGVPVTLISRFGEEPFIEEKHSKYLHADDDNSNPSFKLGGDLIKLITQEK